MATIKKSDTVKITYDQKKIVLKSDTITMEVDMGMAALMAIYASGSGEGKAVYSIKVPDTLPTVAATSDAIAEPSPAPAAPPVTVPVPANPKPEPAAENIPIVIVEGDKDPAPVEEPAPKVSPSEPIENIDDIIREADGEVPATEPDVSEPDAAPIVETDNSGWETVTEETESNSGTEDATYESEPEEDEPKEKKFRGFANKQGWTDTP